MKYLVFLFLLFFTSAKLVCQDTIHVNLFATTFDYNNGKITDTNVVAIVKDLSEEHIWVKEFRSISSGEKQKESNRDWALQYQGNNYFNLAYSLDLASWNTYVKFDIEGKNYCAIFVDDNSPERVKSAGTNYGLGLQGYLMKESNKWNKSWKDKNGNKVKILLIKMKDLANSNLNRKGKIRGNLLKRRELNKLFKLNKPIQEIKKMSFEEIVSIIKINNQ